MHPLQNWWPQGFSVAGLVIVSRHIVHFKDAVVFDETYKQANRRTCVTLPYKGIIKAIEDYKK